jgi:hypothetical protein
MALSIQQNATCLGKDRCPSSFRLDTSGWGTFTIFANVFHKNGRSTSLQHDLVLLYPDGTPTLA